MSIAVSMILSKDSKIMFQVCWIKQRQGSGLTSVENPSMMHLQVGIMKTQNKYVHSLMSNIFYIYVISLQNMILSKDTKIMFQVCWIKQRQGSHLTARENPVMLHLLVGNMKI
jgi:hypothetical protein